MTLTDQQRDALAEIRPSRSNPPFRLGTAESVDQRARQPDPAHLPVDVTVRVEIAPPSPHPHPLLNTGALKSPERVPVYFYALQHDHADAEVADTNVIFFIHGGGNIVGHPTDEQVIRLVAHFLRAAASRSGDASKIVAVAPSYRLATVPENTFPAGLQDVLAAYEHVISKGYKASNIVFSGTSAGGGHTIVLTHLILHSNQPPPRGIIPIAPAAVLFFDQLSEDAKARAKDDILNIPLCEKLASVYVGSSTLPTDPLVSGALLPFAPSWPKTLILVGTGDLLFEGSCELEKRLSALKLPVELVEYGELPHMWWSMPHIFEDDILDAAERVGQFVLEAPLT